MRFVVLQFTQMDLLNNMEFDLRCWSHNFSDAINKCTNVQWNVWKSFLSLH